MGGNNIFIIKNIMSKRLLITESERTHIQKMYGINKGILLFESKDELENKIEDSFDENPDLFLDNIITEIPFLSKFKNNLKDKIKFVMSKGNKTAIVSLVTSLILSLTSCVQNPNGENCKSTKPKNDLELFRTEFEKKHQNYDVDNDIVISRINDTLKTDFNKVINDINWSSIPMMIDRIEMVNGKPIIHFGYGGIELSNSPQTYNLVNIEFFGYVSENESLKLEEEKYYKFDFEIIKQIDINNYEEYSNRDMGVFFNYDINVEVSDSTVIDDELYPPYFTPNEKNMYTYKPMEVNLGAWLVKIKSIRPI